jgi:hypothetical protein
MPFRPPRPPAHSAPAGPRFARALHLVLAAGLFGPASALALAADTPAPISAPQSAPISAPPRVVPLATVESLFASRLLAVAPQPGQPLSQQNIPPALLALARLRDPATIPLFSQLATVGPPALRATALLGLARAEHTRGLDLLLLRQLPPPDRLAALAEAIADDLVTTAQLQDLARWPDQDPPCALLAAGVLVGRGEPPPPAHRLRDLAASPDPAIAAQAAVLLRATAASTPTTKPDPTDATVLAAARALALPQNEAAALNVLARLRLQRIPTAGALCSALLAPSAPGAQPLPPLPPLLAFRALETFALCDPLSPDVQARLLQAAQADAPAGLARLALLMLEVARLAAERLDNTPAAADTLQEAVAALAKADDPLARAAADVAHALLISCGSLPDTIDRLVALRHPPTLAWSLALARSRPFQDAQRIRLAVLLTSAQAAGPNAPETIAAALALLDADPDAAADLLTEHANQPAALTALAAAALRAPAPAGPAFTAALDTFLSTSPLPPDDPLRRLHVLLLVRHRPMPQSPAEQARLSDTLARIAVGEGDLPTVYQLQAGWLALRAAGEDRAALARLLATDPPPPPAPAPQPPATSPR